MKTTLLTLTIALSSFLALGNTDAQARRNKGNRSSAKSTRTQTRTIKRSTYRANARTIKARTYKRSAYKAPVRTIKTLKYKRTVYKAPARTHKRNTHKRNTHKRNTHKRNTYKRNTYKRNTHKRNTHKRNTYKRNTYKRNTYKRNTYKTPAHTRARTKVWVTRTHTTRPHRKAWRHKGHPSRMFHVLKRRHPRKLYRIINHNAYVYGSDLASDQEVALLILNNYQNLDRIIEVRMGDSPFCARNPLEGHFRVASGQALKLPINGQYACYRQLQIKHDGQFETAISGWSQVTLGNYHHNISF